jgi:hypothetical protein
VLRLELVRVEVPHGYYDGKLPERMRLLLPDVSPAFDWVNNAVVTDMYRAPESSLAARRKKRGVQAPGYSAHNFGFAIDLDVSATKKRGGWKNKYQLDMYMQSHGWLCHRRDHEEGPECWHYNHGIGSFVAVRDRSTSPAVERCIQNMWGHQLHPDDAECQRLLSKLGMYSGAIDGQIGPLSREAIRVFRRAWDLGDSPTLDARTRRTLAVVAAERVIIEPGKERAA